MTMVTGSNARHTTAKRHRKSSTHTLQNHFSVASIHGYIERSRRRHSIRSTVKTVHRRGVETTNQ
jgi:hypothetical protein